MTSVEIASQCFSSERIRQQSLVVGSTTLQMRNTGEVDAVLLQLYSHQFHGQAVSKVFALGRGNVIKGPDLLSFFCCVPWLLGSDVPVCSQDG